MKYLINKIPANKKDLKIKGLFYILCSKKKLIPKHIAYR